MAEPVTAPWPCEIPLAQVDRGAVKLRLEPSADQRKAGKPKQRKPGQRNQARPGSNRLPGVGRPCGERQVNRIRNGVRGKVVCARMGSGAHRWVQINGVDPQARKPATKCTGQYIPARGPNGRAMQCTRGRWTYDR